MDRTMQYKNSKNAILIDQQFNNTDAKQKMKQLAQVDDLKVVDKRDSKLQQNQQVLLSQRDPQQAQYDFQIGAVGSSRDLTK